MRHHVAALLLLTLLACPVLAAPTPGPVSSRPPGPRAVMSPPPDPASPRPPGAGVVVSPTPLPTVRAESGYAGGTSDVTTGVRQPAKVSEERVGVLSWLVLLVLAVPLALVGWLALSFLRSVGLARAAEAEREAAARQQPPP